MIRCKMFLSCGELEPELSKLDQFMLVKSANYLAHLMFEHPVQGDYYVTDT